MNEELGIETIRDTLEAVIEFGQKVEEAAADGKVTWTEGISLAVGAIPDAYNIARDGRQLKAEYLDLTDVERDEIVEYIVNELDLDNEDVEVKIEKGFALLVAMDEFISVMRKE